jgi:SNW domain-containing protein 1
LLQIIQFNFVSRFVPDKEFSGTDRSAAPRSGPVQFEKDEEDPFGLDQFLTQAKKAAASKRPKDDREGGSSRKDERSRDDRGDKRRRKD